MNVRNGCIPTPALLQNKILTIRSSAVITVLKVFAPFRSAIEKDTETANDTTLNGYSCIVKVLLAAVLLLLFIANLNFDAEFFTPGSNLVRLFIPACFGHL